MHAKTLTKTQKALIDELVSHYTDNESTIRRFLISFYDPIVDAMREKEPLFGLVHSIKQRMKDPAHLRDKLIRKLRECQNNNKPFPYTVSNLFEKLNDLGGCRLLHLHTQQVKEIHPILLRILDEAQCDLVAKPFAHIWDMESRTYFQSIGIRTVVNPRLYSSLHYVVKPRSKKNTRITCEIQVRTLADEIWGEIDHRLNYPTEHGSLACREQIKSLARVASSCSRLVDSIMATHLDWEKTR